MLIGMGEFFAILVAGIDLSVGAILALSGMVTAKLMLAGVDPFLAALIGGVLVGGALGAINGCWSTGPACTRSLLPSALTRFFAVSPGYLRRQLGLWLLFRVRQFLCRQRIGDPGTGHLLAYCGRDSMVPDHPDAVGPQYLRPRRQ